MTDFYESQVWRELRYKVLRHSEGRCMLCGDSGRFKSLHVDHIKPRSTHPELELEFDNLQVLCEACNIGKSNHYQDDWRPRIVPTLDPAKLTAFINRK